MNIAEQTHQYCAMSLSQSILLSHVFLIKKGAIQKKPMIFRSAARLAGYVRT
jgi:hypothetical protein